MISKQLPNPSHVQLKEIISSYRKHQMMNTSSKLKGGLQEILSESLTAKDLEDPDSHSKED